ncbi:hypothetical protein K8R43_02490 [archaeon]|nr:hypothetical protein [archaeon]
MTCWMKFVSLVARLAKVSEEDAIKILQSIEDDVGHDENLIKAIVDAEREDLIKRLRKKKKREEEAAIAYN